MPLSHRLDEVVPLPGAAEALERALRWHLGPPVRITEPDPPAHGAVRHGLDGERRLGVYTEITG